MTYALRLFQNLFRGKKKYVRDMPTWVFKEFSVYIPLKFLTPSYVYTLIKVTFFCTAF